MRLIIPLLLCSLFFSTSNISAQIGSVPSMSKDPVSWNFKAEQQTDKTWIIMATASIENGFHIWALEPGGDGFLIATNFSIGDEIEWIDEEWKALENPVTIELEYVEGAAVNWHEKEVTFVRKFTTKEERIHGEVEYQTCNETMCLPPTSINFSLLLKQ